MVKLFESDLHFVALGCREKAAESPDGPRHNELSPDEEHLGSGGDGRRPPLQEDNAGRMDW